MNENQIIQLFEDWNSALGTQDPEKVLSLYHTNAVLCPTLSNEVRSTPDRIKDYFVHFLKKGPQGTLNEVNTRHHNDIVLNSGIYTFTFNDNTKATARYSFAYKKEGDSWKIIDHHSSLLPEN